MDGEQTSSVTVIGSSVHECSRNIIQKQHTSKRPEQYTHETYTLPRYVLPVGTQGSTHTPTSDLAEQPAYKFTDINTPEEDTTLDEPQTQRLRIGRQNSQQIPKNSNRNSETKHSITFPNTLNIDKTKREVLLLRCADTLSVGVLGTELI